MRPLAGWIVAGTMVFGSVAAFAVPDVKGPYPSCSTTPTESERKAAQGAFVAGQGSFNEADYATAILYWRDAYRRDCTAHALLVNLARAYELKGDRAESIEALETYLQRKPDDPKADEYQRRIQNLRTQMALAAAQASANAAASASASLPVASSAPPLPATPPPTRVNIPPLIVAGGSAILVLGLGLPLWVAGNNDVKEAEKTCPDHTNCSTASKPTVSQADIDHTIETGNKGRTNLFVGGTLIAMGVAGVTAGAIWYLVSPRKPTASGTSEVQSSKLRLDPAIGANFAGFSLGGSF